MTTSSAEGINKASISAILGSREASTVKLLVKQKLNKNKASKMANEFDIFNVSVGDLDTGEQQKTGSNLYAPKPDQGQDGTYSSLIRFLPNIENARKPYVRKYVYWLEDSEGKGFFVDSPSTVGEKCPVQDTFFKLRNSDSAVDKKMSENLKRKEVYYALVQIVKDPQNTALEGQIKVFKFGWKIKEKIDAELNPKFDEPVQVFDPFEGKNFELNISKKAGYANYDGSKFQNKTSAMILNGKAVKEDDASKKAIVEYLKTAPKLTDWDYTAWTDDERSKVMGILASYSSPGSSIDRVATQRPAAPSAPKATSKAAPAAVAEEESYETSTASAESSEDNLDDFLNGLDI